MGGLCGTWLIRHKAYWKACTRGHDGSVLAAWASTTKPVCHVGSPTRLSPSAAHQCPRVLRRWTTELWALTICLRLSGVFPHRQSDLTWLSSSSSHRCHVLRSGEVWLLVTTHFVIESICGARCYKRKLRLYFKLCKKCKFQMYNLTVNTMCKNINWNQKVAHKKKKKVAHVTQSYVPPGQVIVMGGSVSRNKRFFYQLETAGDDLSFFQEAGGRKDSEGIKHAGITASVPCWLIKPQWLSSLILTHQVYGLHQWLARLEYRILVFFFVRFGRHLLRRKQIIPQSENLTGKRQIGQTDLSSSLWEVRGKRGDKVFKSIFAPDIIQIMGQACFRIKKK